MLNCHLAQLIPINTSGQIAFDLKFSHLCYTFYHFNKPNRVLFQRLLYCWQYWMRVWCVREIEGKCGCACAGGGRVNLETLCPGLTDYYTHVSLAGILSIQLLVPHLSGSPGSLGSSHSTRRKERTKGNKSLCYGGIFLHSRTCVLPSYQPPCLLSSSWFWLPNHLTEASQYCAVHHVCSCPWILLCSCPAN